MFTTIVTILFIIVCILLCAAILLQAAKGGGLGAGLGGGTATTQVFGGRGPGGVLVRATVVLAALFMSMSMLLAYLSSAPQSVLGDLDEEEATPLDEDEVLEEGTLKVNPDGSPMVEGAATNDEAAAVDPPQIEIDPTPRQPEAPEPAEKPEAPEPDEQPEAAEEPEAAEQPE